MTKTKISAIAGVLITAAAVVAMTVIGYIDLAVYPSAPINPNPGYDRLYVTSAGLFCKTSSGANCLPTNTATAGGVNLQTTSYTAVSGDSGKLISMNCSSACTLTLPGTPPSSTWWILTQSTGTGLLTVSRNGLNIDGAATNLTLTQDQGIEISTDASNYFTERGMGSTGGGTFVSLTTTGTTGAATLSSGVLNIPVYSSGGGGGGGGGITLIQEQLLGTTAASITFSSIPGTFRNLRLVMQARCDASATAEDVDMQFNGDTGANYSRQFFFANGSSTGAGQTLSNTLAPISIVPCATSLANTANSSTIEIPNYPSSVFAKSATGYTGYLNGATVGAIAVQNTGFLWTGTAAITSVKLFPLSGNFVTGSVFGLYGY